MHYVAGGDPDAPVLVLLHGASGNLRDWTSSVFDALSARWHVIAFDRPGYGHSDILPGQSWLLAPQSHALRTAMDALGHRHYALFGHSYGVAVALDWAIRYPGEVTGILAMSGAMKNWTGALGWRYRWGSKPFMGTLMGAAVPLIASDALLHRELATVFAPQPVPKGYVTEGAVPLALRAHTFTLNLRAMDALHGQQVTMMPRIREITAPTQVLHGADDVIVPFDADAGPVAALVPAAQTTVLPGIGHMPHHVAQHEVIATSERLLTRL
ncbi:alpha/beta hydrolase [Rhodobacteraceae bacterium NNCM2]|nr:alpha/beta hydrolase [Coraliihabitans acroporae]